ncbi:MAG: hypothetical protein ACE5J7_01300 [Candidatus Aenigmatarchaeota archaeon]
MEYSKEEALDRLDLLETLNENMYIVFEQIEALGKIMPRNDLKEMLEGFQKEAYLLGRKVIEASKETEDEQVKQRSKHVLQEYNSLKKRLEEIAERNSIALCTDLACA